MKKGEEEDRYEPLPSKPQPRRNQEKNAKENYYERRDSSKERKAVLEPLRLSPHIVVVSHSKDPFQDPTVIP